MNHTFEYFNNEIDLFNKDVETSLSENENEWYPILDGPLSPKDYHNANVRIMWLMKEPYDTDGGGWSFFGVFNDNPLAFYKNFVRGGSRTTWQPITYISHALLKGLQKWSDIEDLHEDMINELKAISFVNIQKLPSRNGDGTRTIMQDIYSSYSKNKELLHRQINLLRPQIIICGGTFKVIEEELQCTFLKTIDSCDCYLLQDTVVIDAYHPANTTVTRQRYVDNILKAVKLGLNSLKEND